MLDKSLENPHPRLPTTLESSKALDWENLQYLPHNQVSSPFSLPPPPSLSLSSYPITTSPPSSHSLPLSLPTFISSNHFPPNLIHSTPLLSFPPPSPPSSPRYQDEYIVSYHRYLIDLFVYSRVCISIPLYRIESNTRWYLKLKGTSLEFGSLWLGLIVVWFGEWGMGGLSTYVMREGEGKGG